MATNKTLAPTGVTVQVPAMSDPPSMAVPANAIDKTIDAVNALNSQIVAYYAPSGSSLKQLAFNNNVCPVGRVRWIIPRDCVTTDLPNGNAVYSMARVNRRLANVARIDIYYDNGEIYFASSNDSGSTWSAWDKFAMGSQYVYESKTLGTQTVAGGARAVFNADVGKTGYTLIGIVSIGLSNNYMALGSYTIESTTHAQVVLHNLSSTSVEQTVYVKLLYQKT